VWLTALRWIVPIRYRFPHGQCRQDYSFQQGILIAQRLVFFTALALMGIVYDETAPFELVGIRGPSMIPTMAADGSDLWLCRTYASWWRQYWNSGNAWVSLILPRFKRGDIVGFAHPDSPNSAISCKRIVGLPGDRVQRYGQYVHLFLDQDPEAWGISWPMDEDPNHAWIASQGKSWDTAHLGSSSAASATETPPNPKTEAFRTIVVPEGHVWIEADCPALGLDSRQFGPIPITWIRTRVIAKVWPLQSPPLYRKWYQRPHPIPLDVETLMEYNVFHIMKKEAS
jgi:signal peptidase I